MTNNNRKHRLKLFPYTPPQETVEEAIELAERRMQWRKIAQRVGYYDKDQRLQKILWRRSKRRKEQANQASKRGKVRF